MAMSSNKHQRQAWAEREGRGRGEGSDYVPYTKLSRRQTPTTGRATYARSSFADRHHTLRSELEKRCLVQLCLLNPLDVREHFALAMQSGDSDEFGFYPDQIENTSAIAARLALKHPGDKSGFFRMTTTFVMTTRANTTEVFCVRNALSVDQKLSSTLSIEVEYWRLRRAVVYLITENDLNPIVFGNGLVFRGFKRGPHTVRTLDWLRRVVMLGRRLPMQQVAALLATESEEPREDVIDAIKCAIANGQIKVCLDRYQLDWTHVWENLSINEKTLRWPGLRVLV
jgi:hypothetical protein